VNAASSAPPALTPAAVEKLARLVDEESRARFFNSHRSLIHEAVVEQLAEAVRERVHVDVHEAAALSEAAIVVAKRVASDETMARALRARANAHRFKNELAPAVKLFEEAVRLFERSHNRAEVGRTLSSSIKSHLLCGDYDRALQAVERAAKIFEELGDKRALARLEINAANIFHRQDRFAEALERYERACEQLVPFGDAEGIGVSLHNMAVCLIVLNDFQRALSTYERARAHCERAGMSRLVAQADYNIAYLHYFRGDYSRALEMLRAARLACEKVGDLYHSGLCDLDQAEVYLELNLSNEAAEMALSAQHMFERLGNGYEAARSLTNLAIAVGQNGESFRALELFADARARFEREQNTVWPAVIDLYQALVLTNEGRYFEARRLCASALEFFTRERLWRKVAMCELLIARASLGADDVPEARTHCDRALELAAAIEAPVLDYQARMLRGQIAESAGDVDGAFAAYQAARDRLEAMRTILWGEDLKIAFMTTKLPVYERLVDLCVRRGGDRHKTAEEIFGYVEQAKSRTLRDLFLERIRPVAPIEDGQSDLVRRVRTLREELNWYYHRIELEQLQRDDHSVARLETLQADVREKEHAFIRTLREMPVADRRVVGMHDAPPVTSDTLRATLTADRTIVEYFRTGDQILALVVTAKDLEVVPLTTVARVRKILQMLQFQLSKFQFGPAYMSKVGGATLEGTLLHLHELYDELLAPLPIRRGGHLVIVPHDVLHYVPFHALYDGDAHVIESTDVSYAPSSSIYALCLQRESRRDGRSLVVGVPDERAPLIAQEAHTIARQLPHSTLLLGAEASASALRSLASEASVIHIATHGKFRRDNPLFSGIRLADSFLTLHDLNSLQLTADLVTLSGCGTGLNVVTAGDELRGLVRGLLGAGARSLLATLWDVYDESTAEFMTRFYTALHSGLNKATAVRAAILGLRLTYPHPYYWAPFILVGAQ
jgi:CHAT domain-containing protein